MSVKATVQVLEGSKVSLQVEVPADEVQRSLDQAYQRLAQRVRIPGFRPGRVPPQVLRARLGRQPIYDEALEYLLPRAYREAVEDARIEPVDEPRFDVVQMEEEKPLVFKAEVTVKPEVKLGDTKGMRVERRVVRVGDGDVDRVLRRIQERFAVLEPVDEAVQRGYYAEVDYDALLDGKPFRGGAARGRTIEIGRDQVVPGFDEAITGARAGESRQFELTLPADYPTKDLAGKTLSFQVTVQAVKKKRLPALDDDLAKDVGPYETLDALKQAIRTELEQVAERRARAGVRRQVVEKVTQAASVEVPETMVQRRADRLLRNFAERLAMQGLTLERYLELSGRSASELVSSIEPDARRQILEELVLDAVARQEQLEPDPDAVEKRVEQLMASYRQGQDVGVASERPGGDRRQREQQARLEALEEEVRESVRTSMRRDKAIDWLVEHAEVTEQEAEGGIDDEAELEAILRVEQSQQQPA
ncbi:MAG: trigger factor [Limnochordaceae bacterium]|nr:trigger factor [Limnochordaceae bacterium]